MELENIILSEVSQAVKDNYIICDLTYKWNKTNKQVSKTEPERHENKEQTDSDQRSWGSRLIGRRRVIKERDEGHMVKDNRDG